MNGFLCTLLRWQQRFYLAQQLRAFVIPINAPSVFPLFMIRVALRRSRVNEGL